MTVKIYQGLVGVNISQPNSSANSQTAKSQSEAVSAQEAAKTPNAARPVASSEAIVTTIRAVAKPVGLPQTIRAEGDATTLAQKIAAKLNRYENEGLVTEAHEKLFVYGKGSPRGSDLLS